MSKSRPDSEGAGVIYSTQRHRPGEYRKVVGASGLPVIWTGGPEKQALGLTAAASVFLPLQTEIVNCSPYRRQYHRSNELGRPIEQRLQHHHHHPPQPPIMPLSEDPAI